MKYYLYTFSDNWADEMDLEGFAILTETEKDVALARIKKEFKNGGTLCFGTNEDNEYEDLDEILACITFKEISQTEYLSIKNAFESFSMGEIGPLRLSDLDDNIEEIQEEQFCYNCGGPLNNNNDDELCSDCENEQDEEDRYENEYNKQANEISKFIKDSYSLEESYSFDYLSNFIWKPTPNTEIHITIEEYDDGEEEIELTLKFKSKSNNYKNLEYDFFKVGHIWENPEKFLKPIITKYIKKAQNY